MQPTGGVIAAVAAASVVIAAGGAAAALLIVGSGRPAALDPADAPTTAPVVLQDFDDARDVTLVARFGQEQTLRVGLAGTVTASACAPGTVLRSGAVVGAIDGAPVIGLATSVPMWRDLSPGDVGGDVDALEAALAALGYEVEVDGVIGWSTLSAVEAMLAAAGDDRALDAVPAGRFVWLPAAEVSPAACTVGVGSRIEPGEAIATLPRALDSLRVKELPGDLVDGDRTLAIAGVTAPVDPQGGITDPAALASVGAVLLGSLETASTTLEVAARLSLTAGVAVAAIPPGAIVDLDEDRGCVVTDGRARPVRIVGSQLGQTFVVFEAAPPPAVELSPPDPVRC